MFDITIGGLMALFAIVWCMFLAIVGVKPFFHNRPILQSLFLMVGVVIGVLMVLAPLFT